ncbi:MAG: TlpA family protein disulfide reductase [Hyphomicrobiaceae bacterium]|nr:TlpA family protein disulfide reductase [Hyphomicrobiaceae bacterium]
MSSDDKQSGEDQGYCTPSLAADLFATLVGLALVYGMITLVGNALPKKGGADVRQPAHAAPQNADMIKGQTARTYGAIDIKNLAQYRTGSLAAFALHKQPKPLPAFTYVDEKGAVHSLKELRGKVVLLNLWATWCGPCRHEMPWLDELKKQYGGADFEMLTISIDRGGLAKPRRFFNKIKIKNLELYGDPTGRLAPTLRAFGMPTTLLIDRNGREVGRMAGPAEWNSKEAFAFIEAAIMGGEVKLN